MKYNFLILISLFITLLSISSKTLIKSRIRQVDEQPALSSITDSSTLSSNLNGCWNSHWIERKLNNKPNKVLYTKIFSGINNYEVSELSINTEDPDKYILGEKAKGTYNIEGDKLILSGVSIYKFRMQDGAVYLNDIKYTPCDDLP